MSAIEAFTTATITAFSVGAGSITEQSLDFNESTLPSAFSIVPLMRMVCAVAAEHDAAIIAPASTSRIVLVISFSRTSMRAITVARRALLDSTGRAGRGPEAAVAVVVVAHRRCLVERVAVCLAFQRSKCVDKIYKMAPRGPCISAKSLFSKHLHDSCILLWDSAPDGGVACLVRC